MRNLIIGLVLLLMCGILSAQTAHPPLLDNTRKITDANTSLYNVPSDYDIPYGLPTVENVTEKLLRICRFLEKSTASRIFDPVTGEPITDFADMPNGYVFEPGDFRPYTYEWGVTYIGMLHAYQATGQAEFSDYVHRRMALLAGIAPYAFTSLSRDPSATVYPKDVFVPRELDHAGAIGAAMIQSRYVLPEGGRLPLEPLIDNSITYISQKQYRLPDGTFARTIPYTSTLWLDDMYMSIPALAQAYRLTGREEYLEDALKQVSGFSRRMFIPEKKLYMHSWVTTMEHHPQLLWGRANGWAVLSMAELLDVIPDDRPGRAALLEQFRAHCAGLLGCQSAKGMWHQLLDRPDSYLETSASAIFTYCFARGINRGWLDPQAYGPAAILAWNAVSEQVNNDGQIENVCVGTGVAFEPAYYHYRHVHLYTAHGFGPVLMAGSEVIQLMRNHRFKTPSALLLD